MKKWALLYIVLSYATCSLYSQGKPYGNTEKAVNWGFKIGFNSAIPNASTKTEDGEMPTRTMNKVGYLAEAFMRVNIQKMFIQPEVAYSITREDIYFTGIEETNPTKTTVDININAIDISAIVGYNTVRQNEYGLSVFSGVKLKYAYHIDAKPSNAEKITDTDPFYNIYVTTGLGVNISRLFFDFRYDIALFENRTDISDIQTGPYKTIHIDKKANILSFSMGIMF